MLTDLTTIDQQQIIPSANFKDFALNSNTRRILSESLSGKGYVFDRYTSRATTDFANENYAIIPNQYFLIAKQIHRLAVEAFKYYQIFDTIKQHSDQLLGTSEVIQERIINNPTIKSHFASDADIAAFSKFIDKNDSQYRLKSKSLINEHGKARGSKDCFGSLILKEINTPDASSSILGALIYDLCCEEGLYERLNESLETIQGDPDLQYLTTIYKPFLLLAGISGTGKTRFIRKQAEATGRLNESYLLSPVRPDWHEPSDLLGYVSRITETPRFVSTEVMKFIINAWKFIFDCGLACPLAEDDETPRLIVEGSRDDLDRIKPFWLCLDEMNLAPVEQYFSDYLSILETREWHWDNDQFTYQSDALLKPLVFSQVDTAALRHELELDDSYDELWEIFCRAGIPLPFNLMVAGTVNMDETTHGFSRKVLDRALSIDFGEFFPNNYAEFFEPNWQPKALSYPIYSHAKRELLANCIDSDGQSSINFLEQVNQCITGTPFQLAYRALNELLLAVISVNPQTEIELLAVWDDFLMCKVLPRIEGDYDKLGGEESVLVKLNTALKESLASIWNDDEARPDLFREKTDGSPISITCHSKKKIAQMQAKLDTHSFTSFWP